MTQFMVKGKVPEITPHLISFSIDDVDYCSDPKVVRGL